VLENWTQWLAKTWARLASFGRERISGLRHISRKSLLRWMGASAILVFTLAIGFLIPYFIRLYDNPATNFVDNVGTHLAEQWQGLTGSDEQQALQTMRLSTIFTHLEGDVVALPEGDLARPGGATTSWDDHLVALTQDGRIFLINPDREVTRSGITPPDSGYEDYVEISQQPPYDAYWHNYQSFRYNDIHSFAAGGQRGLVVSYLYYDREAECYSAALARLFVDTIENAIADASDWDVIFTSQPCLPLKDRYAAIDGQAGGGRVVFDQDRTIYMTIGDFFWDGMYGPESVPGSDLPTTQDPENDYGRVVAIDVLEGTSRRVTIGQRNPQGITVDLDGEVWTVEHGPRGGDELNHIVEGANYGWPYASYGTQYTEAPLPKVFEVGRHDDFKRPALAWLPSIAVSSLTTIDGFHEAWDGDLLAGTLNGQKLVRIRTADQTVIFAEPIELGFRIRDVHQHSTGELVVYNELGQLVFLTPVTGDLAAQYVENFLDFLVDDAATINRLRTAVAQCQQCHSFSANEHGGAPSLSGVMGRRVGSTSFSAYSDEMRADNRVWTRELLIEYLKDPQTVIPGTVMPALAEDDEKVLNYVADLLYRVDANANSEEPSANPD